MVGLSDRRWTCKSDCPICSKRRRRFAGCVSCKDEPALEHCIQEGDTTVLRRVQFPQRENLVQPLQLCRAVHALRIDQLPCRREALMGQRCHADQ